jgi:sterol desaturase/sphingolipid hydroxylase (fatty acid hydroxylase superfamily)
MIPAEAVIALQRAATWSAALSVLVLLVLEAAVPRTTNIPSGNEKARHVMRNALLWASGAVLGWILIGGMSGTSQQRPTIPVHGFGLWLPLAAQLVLAVLVLDLGEYWRHRLFHFVRPLWLVHMVHHSDQEVDVTTGLRFHPLETMLVISSQLALLFMLGLPIWALAVHALFQGPISAFQHAAIRLPTRIESVLGWLLVTPAIHRVHHSRLRGETDSNYGAVFSFWDRLFGTYTPPLQASGSAMGLNALTADSWQTTLGMLIMPIRARGIAVF